MGIEATEGSAQPGKRVRTAADRASSNPGGRTSFIEPTLLSALAIAPGYGYDLKRIIEQMTEGLVLLDLPGTYRILRRWEGEGLVESAWTPGASGPRRREYALTPAGWALLADWRQFLDRQRRVCDLTRGALDAALSVAGRDRSASDPRTKPINQGGGA